jgi:hypothetical protein
MPRANTTLALAIAATFALPNAALTQASTAPVAPRTPGARAAGSTRQAPQAVTVVGHSAEISSREATVRFELSDGESRTLSLRRGGIYLDGDRIGEYPDGALLERAWRGLVSQGGELNTFQMALAIRALPAADLTPEAAAAWETALAAVPELSPEVAAAVVPVPVTRPVPPTPVTPGFGPDFGTELAAQIGAAVEEAQRARGIAERLSGREARFTGGVVTDVVGLLGMLVALASLGFGAVFFVPQRLEVVADTVAKSPVRAFFAGLFAQPLLLPALVTLIVGLVLTIVGVLVVPVAIVGFVLATILAALGGYLAVARVVGEIYVRRTGRQNLYTTGWATYRYIVYGLIGLLAIWLPALALQWVPAAGWVLLLSAAVFTWIIMTAGLGGVVLSRAGTRSTFGSKPAAQLSAEFSWTTPRATTGVSEARRSS